MQSLLRKLIGCLRVWELENTEKSGKQNPIMLYRMTYFLRSLDIIIKLNISTTSAISN